MWRIVSLAILGSQASHQAFLVHLDSVGRNADKASALRIAISLDPLEVPLYAEARKQPEPAEVNVKTADAEGHSGTQNPRTAFTRCLSAVDYRAVSCKAYRSLLTFAR